MLIVFAVYLALLHREPFRDVWAGYAFSLLITVFLALPLAFAIARGSSEAAAQGIGADARLVELARPIRALQQGDPAPLLDNVWTTLGMFHTTGDPEWLYNISNRPVFNPLGGLLFWGGVLLCLYRWRQPRYFFLLLWLLFGLLPTVLSVPPASLSHSILVQPLAYLLPILVLKELYCRSVFRPVTRSHYGRWEVIARYAFFGVMVLFLSTNALRDLRDYFSLWPEQPMVRFLYRADYRQAARYLDENPEFMDVVVGSTLLGPWDRLALSDDLRREDIHVRLFNPEWSLLLPSSTNVAGPEQKTAVLVTAFPPLNQAMQELLGASPKWQRNGLQLYDPPDALPFPSVIPSSPALFSNGLQLEGASWPDGEPEPGRAVVLWLIWQVARPLDLPPMPIVANPPPAGVYSGPRLAVFAHLLNADGSLIAGDDGLWVDAVTLSPGDRFLQIHRLSVPAEASPGPYALEVGLYDPLTDERWAVLDAGGQPVTDHLLLPSER
jgi:hypothetical protein